MSTYNGMRYLREQVESILCQEDVDVSIFVRDDGSTDGTVALLKALQEEYGSLHISAEENLGVGRSFMRALYFCPDSFDYYAFSDQDDIWMPNKLKEAISVLARMNKGLYTSNQMCVDADGQMQGLRYKELPDLRRYSTLQQNRVSGCTMVMTQKFFCMLTDPIRRPGEDLFQARIHDVWVAMAGIVTKQLVYDRRSFILYRQHGGNVVSAKKITSMDRIRTAAKKWNAPSKRRGRSKLARELCRCYGEYVGTDRLMKACAHPEKWANKRLILQNYGRFHAENRTLFYAYVLLNLF